MWRWDVVTSAKVEERREAGLPVERLQPRREDRVGRWVHRVPAVHVRLHRVGAARSFAAGCVARAVLPLLPRLLPLLQGLAEQALVVPVLHDPTLVLVLLLKFRARWPQPRLALSFPVVSRSFSGGLPAQERYDMDGKQLKSLKEENTCLHGRGEELGPVEWRGRFSNGL